MQGLSIDKRLRGFALTAVAMGAFAANSLLCRSALGAGLVDPASFAAIRIAFGTAALGVFLLVRGGDVRPATPDLRTVGALFAYMICFSFAYVSLPAGTGALVLFGAVQISMFVSAVRAGEPFPAIAWIGLSLAIAGLVYLVSPGLSAPDPVGAVLMAVAGGAWGLYSLSGKGIADPLQATAGNFAYALPPAALVLLLFSSEIHLSWGGVVLAAISGAVASGGGYVIWYAALRGLSAGRAATVQLSVPVIAAFGGVAILSEPLTLRLLVASAATLGGVALVMTRRAHGLGT